MYSFDLLLDAHYLLDHVHAQQHVIVLLDHCNHNHIDYTNDHFVHIQDLGCNILLEYVEVQGQVLVSEHIVGDIPIF